MKTVRTWCIRILIDSVYRYLFVPAFLEPDVCV